MRRLGGPFRRFREAGNVRTIEARVAGEACRGWVPENDADLAKFRAWVCSAAQRGDIAVDSETTGLDVYVPGFRVRLIQFGTDREGWLIPVEWGQVFADTAAWALEIIPKLTIQNFPFDGLAFDHKGFAPLERIATRVTDTKILAHLIDSRPPEEGGVGTSLKPLAVQYVDPKADDGQKALVKIFNSMGHTKVTGWAAIDLMHPEYLRYALLDVLLLSRLLPVLRGICRDMGVPAALAEYEHEQAYIGAVIQRAGMLVDAPYTEGLVTELTEEAEAFLKVANQYGVTSVNAPKQVAAALVGMGEAWDETTESGQPAVGKEVLLPMADLDKQWHRIGARTPNPLADAVLRSKRAGKWSTSYGEAMLRLRDADGRIHPHINTMGARTARWSVSGPPLQQLPSSDWRVRRSIIAKPGHVIVASDFSQVELRVLAALADARDICARINGGEDLHTLTTRMVFNIGPEVTDAELAKDPRRKLTKTISLGKAYGGGLDALSKQTGLPRDQVKQALAKYDRALPAIKRFARLSTDEAFRNKMTVTTPSGRLLRLSRDKAFTAVAYKCQSTARDILGQSLVDMRKRGLLEYVIGVVHDEVIGEAPEDIAGDVVRELGECMTFRNAFGMVDITSDPEVYGDNWGMGYKGPARELVAA
jgi:DNA polymerase-1